MCDRLNRALVRPDSGCEGVGEFCTDDDRHDECHCRPATGVRSDGEWQSWSGNRLIQWRRANVDLHASHDWDGAYHSEVDILWRAGVCGTYVHGDRDVVMAAAQFVK